MDWRCYGASIWHAELVEAPEAKDHLLLEATAVLRIRYDPSVDALYIRLRDGPIEESDEVASRAILDGDEDGKALAIEILEASHLLGGREMKVELAVAEGQP